MTDSGMLLLLRRPLRDAVHSEHQTSFNQRQLRRYDQFAKGRSSYTEELLQLYERSLHNVVYSDCATI